MQRKHGDDAGMPKKKIIHPMQVVGMIPTVLFLTLLLDRRVTQ